MCKKVAYPNRFKAHQALKLICYKGKRMRAYTCDRCYKWHLTSNVSKR